MTKEHEGDVLVDHQCLKNWKWSQEYRNICVYICVFLQSYSESYEYFFGAPKNCWFIGAFEFSVTSYLHKTKTQWGQE